MAINIDYDKFNELDNISLTECYELRENEGLIPILADGRIVNFVKENGYSK